MSKPPSEPAQDLSPVSTVAPTPAALDLSVLEQITGGSSEMLVELLGDFADMSKKLVGEMASSLERGDAKGLGRAAHTLKGSSGLIGAQALRFKCEALEKAVMTTGIGDARDLLAAVEQIHAATMLLLEAAIRRAA